MLVIGEKEEADGKVAVRRQAKGDLGTMETAEFIKVVEDEVVNRKPFE